MLKVFAVKTYFVFAFHDYVTILNCLLEIQFLQARLFNRLFALFFATYQRRLAYA